MRLNIILFRENKCFTRIKVQSFHCSCANHCENIKEPNQTLNCIICLGLLQDCVVNCVALKIKGESEESGVFWEDLQEINCVKSQDWSSCAHFRRTVLQRRVGFVVRVHIPRGLLLSSDRRSESLYCQLCWWSVSELSVYSGSLTSKAPGVFSTLGFSGIILVLFTTLFIVVI